MIDILQQVTDVRKTILNAQTASNDQLSHIDKTLTDLYHYLELESLDAVGMIKVAVKIKLKLKERRIIKNDMQIGRAILDNFPKKSLPEVYLKSLEKVERQQYRARVITLQEAKA